MSGTMQYVPDAGTKIVFDVFHVMNYVKGLLTKQEKGRIAIY